MYCISGFPLIFQLTALLQPAVVTGETLSLCFHLQHFPQIQIPDSIIPPLHSDVLPLILALYYRQLSPVLGRRKKDFFCFFLAGHFTEAVSPYRLGALEAAQCHPCSTSRHNGRSLVIVLLPPWLHLNDLRSRNHFLHGISKKKRFAV